MKRCVVWLSGGLALSATAFGQVQFDGCLVETWSTQGTAQIGGENGFPQPLWGSALTLDFVNQNSWTKAYSRTVSRGGAFYSTGGTFTYMAMAYDPRQCGEIRTDSSCMKPIGNYYRNDGKRVDLWALRSREGYWNTSISLTGYCMHYTGY